MKDIEVDEFFMEKAICLARNGVGKVNPNPLVGAVIVKNSKIIAEGYHKKYGDFHAERDAIFNYLKENGGDREGLNGATMYVTLTPCCHWGKQPPCTDAIIENKISRVVIGSRDPNPLVGEKSIKILEDAGIEVKRDCLKEECDRLNDVFFKYIQKKQPYVVMKYAMTADGKIATKTNESKWITGEGALKYVHTLRNKYKGIMVGINTVLVDDPMLNCRLEAEDITEVRNPIRIICDSKLRIPMDSNIVKTANQYPTIIATAFSEFENGEINIDKIKNSKVVKEIDEETLNKIFELRFRGIILINAVTPNSNLKSKSRIKVDLKTLMSFLGEIGIDGILLEGGATLNEDALKSEVVDEIICFIAPKIFGGKAKSPVEGLGISKIEKAYKLSLKNLEMLGGDVMIGYKVCKKY
ncbi:MAG: bifunctional diaminohydroxyphosphoribosylaminopyrimidine deaminase/5-amino-6-(5-phosphoribosylamino)uracil reductase RibD [Lachnobacterium sp.]|nr:bifunctional diaminohydroxyphosphoribosylaminopyrimidine deaminase/5-amino-6-(5-phosphoribosylamino)uracil reductase RibD [Lachnobacterium sp.]